MAQACTSFLENPGIKISASDKHIHGRMATKNPSLGDLKMSFVTSPDLKRSVS